jgi:NAD(P)-dependent dehydrogenase (short-subunit alcohol dehydrogenase family)
VRNLDEEIAVVTGGTYGVGRGIASALAQVGARVFVTVVNEDVDATSYWPLGARWCHR